jgi:hypothetical protein
MDIDGVQARMLGAAGSKAWELLCVSSRLRVCRATSVSASFFFACVIAVKGKTAPVEVLDPPFDRDLPVRVIVKEPGNDAYANHPPSLAGAQPEGSRWKVWAGMFLLVTLIVTVGVTGYQLFRSSSVLQPQSARVNTGGLGLKVEMNGDRVESPICDEIEQRGAQARKISQLD